jgi:hypothetical protein
MARYPELPSYFFSKSAANDDEKRKELYMLLQQWGAALINELDFRDVEVDATPTTNIFSVVTTSDIGRPKAGDVAYSASAGQFRGYVSIATTTAWFDLGGA